MSKPLLMDNRFFLGSLILIFLLAWLNSLFFSFFAIGVVCQITFGQHINKLEKKFDDADEKQKGAGIL